jgi:dUTP pyrophosphatase
MSDTYVLWVNYEIEDPDLLPKYQTQGSSGCDLRSSIDAVIPAGKRQMVPTGLKVEIPVGFEGQVRPRSGLAAKHGITVLNTPGTVDCDYRGEIKVILLNTSDEDFIIKKGDRIAQLVFSQVFRAIFKKEEALTSTERAEGGFGSTGRA